MNIRDLRLSIVNRMGDDDDRFRERVLDEVEKLKKDYDLTMIEEYKNSITIWYKEKNNDKVRL